jgi:ribosomal protein S18 acetylase RimI-like enzyme
MLIRPIEDADIFAAAALLRRAAEEFILHESTPQDAAAFLADQGEAALRSRIASGYVYHVALVDGELAGFVGVRERSHVYGLYVDKRYQRRGIGRALWERGRAAASRHVHRECLQLRRAVLSRVRFRADRADAGVHRAL